MSAETRLGACPETDRGGSAERESGAPTMTRRGGSAETAPGSPAQAPPGTSAEAQSVFVEVGGMIVPTEDAIGPWDSGALHGGAPAALITSTFERMRAESEMKIGRLSFQFLRPVPFSPMRLTCEIVRPGRRVEELAAELTDAEGRLICRAKALRLQRVPSDIEEKPSGDSMRGPESGKAVRFALYDVEKRSFASSAMEMRWITDPWSLGAGQVWMRMRLPVLPGQSLSPLTLLAATSDFGNGVSSELRFDRYIFINADLTIHLQREPKGEWIGLDARTLLHPGGTGLSESVLHDLDGPIGRAFQTLVVQSR